MLYSDLRLQRDAVLQDAAGDLKPEDRDRLAQEAVRRYSAARPRLRVEDLTGNGGHDYAVTLFAAWTEGFSVVQSVEFPLVANATEPQYLERDDWREYVAPSGRVLRLLKDAPAATQTIRVTYSALHVASDASFTVSDGDFDALAKWAAVGCLSALAHLYAQNVAPTIGVDSVDHAGKSERYAKRAAELWKEVAATLHLSLDETAAGTATLDWGSGFAFGQGYLTHERRRR